MTAAGLKRELARQLRRWIKAQHMPQRELAPRLRLHQSQISWVMTGKLKRVRLHSLLIAWFAIGGELILTRKR